MRLLLAVLGFCLINPAYADEGNFDFKSKKAKAAIEKYQATIKNAKAVEKRNRVDLILALEAALKYERTEGELDEAIKIRDAIKALKKGVSPAEASAAVAEGKKSKDQIPKEDEPYVEYYDNGQKKIERHFKDGKQDGLETVWYENGQKQAEAHLKNGEYDGRGTYWYENGQKQAEVHYKDGKEDGLGTAWDENGKKAGEIQYKDGKEISRKEF